MAAPATKKKVIRAEYFRDISDIETQEAVKKYPVVAP